MEKIRFYKLGWNGTLKIKLPGGFSFFFKECFTTLFKDLSKSWPKDVECTFLNILECPYEHNSQIELEFIQNRKHVKLTFNNKRIYYESNEKCYSWSKSEFSSLPEEIRMFIIEVIVVLEKAEGMARKKIEEDEIKKNQERKIVVEEARNFFSKM